MLDPGRVSQLSLTSYGESDLGSVVLVAYDGEGHPMATVAGAAEVTRLLRRLVGCSGRSACAFRGPAACLQCWRHMKAGGAPGVLGLRPRLARTSAH